MNRKEAYRELKRTEKDIRWLSRKIDEYRKLEEAEKKRKDAVGGKWKGFLITAIIFLLLTLLIYTMLMFDGDGRYESTEAFLMGTLLSAYLFAGGGSLYWLYDRHLSSYSSRISDMKRVMQKLMKKEEKIYDRFPDLPPIKARKINSRDPPELALPSIFYILSVLLFLKLPLSDILLPLIIIPPISILILWANMWMNRRRLERILSE